MPTHVAPVAGASEAAPAVAAAAATKAETAAKPATPSAAPTPAAAAPVAAPPAAPPAAPAPAPPAAAPAPPAAAPAPPVAATEGVLEANAGAAAPASAPMLDAAILSSPCCTAEGLLGNRLAAAAAAESAAAADSLTAAAAAAAALLAAEPGISTASNTPDTSPLGAPSKLAATTAPPATAAGDASQLQQQQLLSLELQQRELQQQQLQLHRLEKQLQLLPIQSKQQPLLLQPLLFQQSVGQLQQQLQQQQQQLQQQQQQLQQQLLEEQVQQQLQQQGTKIETSGSPADLAAVVAAATAAAPSSSSSSSACLGVTEEKGLAAAGSGGLSLPSESSAGDPQAAAAAAPAAAQPSVLDTLSDLHERLCLLLDVTMKQHNEQRLLLQSLSSMHHQQHTAPAAAPIKQEGAPLALVDGLNADAVPQQQDQQQQHQQQQQQQPEPEPSLQHEDMQQHLRRAQQQSLRLDSQLLGLAADLHGEGGAAAAALQQYLRTQAGLLPPPRTPTAATSSLAAQQAFAAAVGKGEATVAAAAAAAEDLTLKQLNATVSPLKPGDCRRRLGARDSQQQQQQQRLPHSAARKLHEQRKLLLLQQPRSSSNTVSATAGGVHRVRDASGSFSGGQQQHQPSAGPSASVYSRGSNAKHLHDPYPHSVMIQLIQPLPTGIKLELKSHKASKSSGASTDGALGGPSGGPAPREYALRVSLTRHETKYCSFHSLHGIMPAYNEAVRLRNRFAGLPFDLPLMTEADLRERKKLIDQGRPLPNFGPKEAFMTVQERTIFYKQGRGDPTHTAGIPSSDPRAPGTGGGNAAAPQQEGEIKRGELQSQQLREDPEATTALRGLGAFASTPSAVAAMQMPGAAAPQQQRPRSSRKRPRVLMHATGAAAPEESGAVAHARATPKPRRQQPSNRTSSPLMVPVGKLQWAGDETGSPHHASSSSSSFGDGIAEALLQFPSAAVAAAGSNARRSGVLIDSLAGPLEALPKEGIDFGLQQQQHGDETLRTSSSEAGGAVSVGPVTLPLGGPSGGPSSEWEATAVAANIAASMGLPLEEFAERLSLFIRRAEGRAAAAAAAGGVGDLEGGDTTHHASPALEAALSAVEARGGAPHFDR